MTFANLLVEDRGAVRRITLNRPDKRNALNTDMYLALTEAFQQAAQDESVHVVLLQGQQECFTAGNDLAGALSFFAIFKKHPIQQIVFG